VSRKPESVFIDSVHKHLPKSLYRIKNNNPYAGGQPDCWYSGSKADLWVEYKYIERIPKAGVSATLSELQKQWLYGRYHEGRNVAVVIGFKNVGIILRDLNWEKTIPPTEFSIKTKTRQFIANWILSEVEAVHVA